MKHFFILMILFCLFSCFGNEDKIKKDLATLMSKPINLPTKSPTTVLGKDTAINNFFDSEVKMVVYADSTGCTFCSINKIYLWEPFVEFAKTYDGKLKFYFIYAPTKRDNRLIRMIFCTNIFDYPVIIDETGEFEKMNPHLPKNKALHTFLLDENNKVILVGNPLHNKEIEKLFYKKTQELLAK